MGYDIRVDGSIDLQGENIQKAAASVMAARDVDPPRDNSLSALRLWFHMLTDCWFVADAYESSGIPGINFHADDYIRNEEEIRWLFDAIAPFASGGFDFCGEDGYEWRWSIENGKILEEGGATLYGQDAEAPALLEKIIELVYFDGKPRILEGSDAEGTLYAIENIIREGGFGPQAGMNELDRLADV